MEDLVEDVRAGVSDDGGECCHCVVVGDVLGGPSLQLFPSLSSITSVTSSAATSRVAVIIGGGGSGGSRSGVLGTRSPERVWNSDGFIVRKECP